jgi:phosphohistidine swiveling domain-containing protein
MHGANNAVTAHAAVSVRKLSIPSLAQVVDVVRIAKKNEVIGRAVALGDLYRL